MSLENGDLTSRFRVRPVGTNNRFKNTFRREKNNGRAALRYTLHRSGFSLVNFLVIIHQYSVCHGETMPD